MSKRVLYKPDITLLLIEKSGGPGAFCLAVYQIPQIKFFYFDPCLHVVQGCPITPSTVLEKATKEEEKG